MNDTKTKSELVDKIADFLKSIGIGVTFEKIDGATVLPGINVRKGGLLIDVEKLKYPGDLLHEAGHLAVVSAERRTKMDGNVGQKAHEEMTAIAWSYAAAVHLEIAPDILFHADGYRGAGDSLIDNFTNGHYFAVCTLQWLGLTVEPKKNGTNEDGEVYPKMKKWVLD